MKDMEILDDDKFASKLLEEIEHLKYGLKYYINKSKGLERELDYYKKAYENRVNEFIKQIKEDYKNIENKEV